MDSLLLLLLLLPLILIIGEDGPPVILVSVSEGTGEALVDNGGVADGVSVSTFTRGLSLPNELRPPILDMDCMEGVGDGDE